MPSTKSMYCGTSAWRTQACRRDGEILGCCEDRIFCNKALASATHSASFAVSGTVAATEGVLLQRNRFIFGIMIVSRCKRNPFYKPSDRTDERTDTLIDDIGINDARVNLIDESPDQPKRGATNIAESCDVENGGFEANALHLNQVVQRHVKSGPRPMQQLQQSVETFRRNGAAKIGLENRYGLQTKTWQVTRKESLEKREPTKSEPTTTTDLTILIAQKI